MAYEKRREAEKEALRQKVIGIAQKVFIEKEFENISIDEIADLSGITKRNIHRFFINKKDLFYAVMEKIPSFLLQALAGTKEEQEEPAKRLEHLFQQLFLNYYDKAEIFLLFNRFVTLKKQTESTILPQRVNFLASYEGIMEELIKVCQEGIEKKQFKTELSAKDVAGTLMASAFGLLVMHAVVHEEKWENQRQEEESKMWTRFLMNGIGYKIQHVEY